jgi:hypothetical protein
MRLKNYDFSFTSVQKILQQITRIRYRSALLELLKSTLFKGESLFDDKVRTLASACSLYCKAKKKDKPMDLSLDTSSTKAIFNQLYSTLVSMLSDVLSSDVPDYFHLAALDCLTFSLRHQELISKEEIMTSINTVLDYIKRLGSIEPFEWQFQKGKYKLVNSQNLKESIRKTSEMNLLLQKVLAENMLEVPQNLDPYLSSTPLILASIDNYLSCLNSMLPSLSAYILRKTFNSLMEGGVQFTFGIPIKLLVVIEKIVEKTIVICQADVHIPIETIQTLIVCLTVFNNLTYRQKVERMHADGEDAQITAKETLALYMQAVPSEGLDQISAAYSSLWETLKTKYIFLIGLNNLKNLMVHIASRLQELSQELESQVFTSEFDDFELKSSRATENISGFNELKFEKVKTKVDSPLLISTKDLTKSKLDYLKNFRDIFGELEYYLELIDCLSGSIKEKSSQNNYNDLSSQGQENTLDRVSKKLISNFTNSGLQIINNLDSKFWDICHEIACKILLFLKIFLKDSVFIDYFQSSWVILCNLLSTKPEQRDFQINLFLFTLLQSVDSQQNTVMKLSNPHLLKCLYYILDYTSKTIPLNYDEKVNEVLVRIMSKLFGQVRHSQNTDLIRLLRFLMNKYPEVMNEEAIPDLFTLFLDNQFDLLGENSTKLFDQFIEIACKRQDKDTVLATLVQVILGWNSSCKGNLSNTERRRQILAKRRKKQAPDVSKKSTKEVQVLDLSKRLGLLMKIFDKINPKLIVEFSRISLPITRFLPDSEEHELEEEPSESSLFPFINSAMAMELPELDLNIVKLLLLFLQKVKPNSSSVSKSSVTVCQFVLSIISLMSQKQFLSSECRHELLLSCLMVFSVHLPPASFDEELEK